MRRNDVNGKVLGFVCALVGLLAVPCRAATGDSFSFAVVADPHIAGGPTGTSAQRLQEAVDWINAHRSAEQIDIVFVVGDNGWGAGMGTAKDILDSLDMPYAPLMGDNEIHAGDDAAFQSAYEPLFDSLEALTQEGTSGFSAWKKAAGPVYVPSIDDTCYLQNFGFTYRGVNFACLDWVKRDLSVGFGEDAATHNFTGGTLPWLGDYLATMPKDKHENTVMLAHHPMFTLGGEVGIIAAASGAFAPGEMAEIEGLLLDPNHSYDEYVSVAFGGHFHTQGYLPEDADPNLIELHLDNYSFDPNDYDPNGPIQFVPLPGYELHLVDDTHYDPHGLPDDPIRLNLVTVEEQADAFSYTNRVIIVPEPTAGLLFAAVGLLRARRRRRRPVS